MNASRRLLNILLTTRSLNSSSTTVVISRTEHQLTPPLSKSISTFVMLLNASRRSGLLLVLIFIVLNSSETIIVLFLTQLLSKHSICYYTLFISLTHSLQYLRLKLVFLYGSFLSFSSTTSPHSVSHSNISSMWLWLHIYLIFFCNLANTSLSLHCFYHSLHPELIVVFVTSVACVSMVSTQRPLVTRDTPSVSARRSPHKPIQRRMCNRTKCTRFIEVFICYYIFFARTYLASIITYSFTLISFS